MFGVPGYEVSDDGRVRSEATGAPVAPSGENNGCLTVWLRRPGGGGSQYYIHRLVAEAYLPDEFLTTPRRVRHANGDRHDNRAGNLSWVYPSRGPSAEERIRAMRDEWRARAEERPAQPRVCGSCSRFTDLTGRGSGRCRDLGRSWNTESWATCARWAPTIPPLPGTPCGTGNGTGTGVHPQGQRRDA